MFQLDKLTPDARAYFDSLTPMIQESLVQAGMDYSTKEELERFAIAQRYRGGD